MSLDKASTSTPRNRNAFSKLRICATRKHRSWRARSIERRSTNSSRRSTDYRSFPPKSSPFRCKTIGAAADGNRAISAASSFQSLPTCEIASTDATASKNGQPNPTRPSGEINVGDFDPPNMPNMPKSLSHKEDLRADSFLYVPRKCPQRNCCGMGIGAGRAAWAGVKSVRTKSQEVSNEDQGDKDEGARRLVAAIRNSGDVARTQIHGVA